MSASSVISAKRFSPQAAQMRHVIFLLSGFTVLCSFSLDEPIIMERIVHRVEWDELLFEYDSFVAPVRNMTVEVNATLVSYQYESYPKRIAHAIYDTVFSWIDQRLRIPTGVKVSVPDTVKIWKPKIIIHNAISNQIVASALSYSNNRFQLHERMLLQLSFQKKQQEVFPIFRVFEDGTAGSIDLIKNIQGAVPLNTSTEGWLLS